MISIEKSAKTMKEAIRLGLEELNCDSSEVDIEVLEMGSHGIFGMFGKPVKVRLTRKSSADDFKMDMPKITLDGGASGKKARGEKQQPRKKNKEPKADAPAAEESAPAEKKTEKKPERKSRPRPRRDVKPQDEAGEQEPQAPELPPVEEEPFEPTSPENYTEYAAKAKDFIDGLCSRMDIPVTIDIQETPEQLRVKLSGEKMSMLIGRRGETLDSIQYLTSLCVNRGREDYLRVSIDTENYRAKREEALRKLAMRMANRVRKNGRRVALEPMNPYERRILHSALQNDPDVTTHSEGEEPYRRVIITLK